MGDRKKVLIITYYWPPSGGSGVQRWLKFAKYLPQFGWTPVIFTPENPSFAIRDASLVDEIPVNTEIVKLRIWEPYDLFFGFSRLLGNKGSAQTDVPSTGEKTFFQRLSTWVRGNFFIPDPRVFWVNPSVRFLSRYLQTNPVDAIISTGPPHSLHLIAMRLSEKFGIAWMADFRDPWTTMVYFPDLKLTARSSRKHHRLENRILRTANSVVVIGELMKKEFEEKRKGAVVVIPNGYDAEDFTAQSNIQTDGGFSLLHVGSFLSWRNPMAFWTAISELVKEGHPMMELFKMTFIGRADPSVLGSIRAFGLDAYLSVEGYQPHADVIRRMQSAPVLFLPIDNFDGSKWVLTSKLFEYLGARRPILCIGPTDGDAARIIRETEAGQTFDFSDHAGMKQHLITLYDQFRSGSLGIDSHKTESYSRAELTRKLAGELDKFVK